MNLQKDISELISKAFEDLFNHSIPTEEIKLQDTKKEFEGNITFVTFPYGRFSKKSPEETARMLGEYLVKNTKIISDFNVVKGFLNLSVSDGTWLQLLSDMNSSADYGYQAIDDEQVVVVEYSSPNTNKPLHLGHLRNNFLGFSAAQILEAAGKNVKKVNLVNDRGIHICKSMLAYQKFGNNETPESASLKGDHLIGKYYVRFDQEYKKEVEALTHNGTEKEVAEREAPLMQEAQGMLKSWENKDPETVELWEKMNGWVYQGFDQTYERMGVSFDKIYHESDTYLLGKNLVDEGLEKGVFFKKDDGSVWADLTEEGLDQKLLLRSDGTSVYMTQDLGTAELKYTDYHFTNSIYVVGNEQDYHFDVLFKILKKLGRSYADGLYHLSYGMVDLPTGKMKSREGTVVDADDLMEEMAQTAKRHTEELGKIDGFTEEEANQLYETLALGALKYYLLKVDPKKRMLFNPEESIEFHGNTGPFIQYTHARISAILRKAEQIELSKVHLDVTTYAQLHEAERSVIVLLEKLPWTIQEAAENYSPATIANYVYEVAKEYNRFYTELPIFNEDDQEATKFRVVLSAEVAKTIKTAMKLLGIEVPNRM